MWIEDQFGLPLPSGAAPAVADWNRCVEGFLAHSAETPARLDAALSAAPDFALAQATRGLFFVLLARPECLDVARGALDAARTGAPDPRSPAYVEALELGLLGRLGAAADRLDALLLAHPEDALAAKLVHALRFMVGDAVGMRASIERVLGAVDRDHAHRPFLLGCHAFALEETGEYDAAERIGRTAVEARPDDAWGLHAVLHVHEMTARAAEGLRWMEGREAGWRGCNNFAFHIHWHVALFRLDLGDREGALRLYDERVRTEPTEDFRDIANAASLLARLEIEGVEVGRRWEELADIAQRRAADACSAFADLHYLLALVGAGRRAEAEVLAARIAAEARRCDAGDMPEAARAGGGLAASGLAALAGRDDETAARRLVKAAPRLQRIGGSHAQRDVFHWIAVSACLRAGRRDLAAEALAERGRRRIGCDGFTRRRLEDCEDGPTVARP
ncbi:MAG: tetratricopeptide repeat protein [Paracoccaceae bacterium]